MKKIRAKTTKEAMAAGLHLMGVVVVLITMSMMARNIRRRALTASARAYMAKKDAAVLEYNCQFE